MAFSIGMNNEDYENTDEMDAEHRLLSILTAGTYTSTIQYATSPELTLLYDIYLSIQQRHINWGTLNLDRALTDDQESAQADILLGYLFVESRICRYYTIQWSGEVPVSRCSRKAPPNLLGNWVADNAQQKTGYSTVRMEKKIFPKAASCILNTETCGPGFEKTLKFESNQCGLFFVTTFTDVSSAGLTLYMDADHSSLKEGGHITFLSTSWELPFTTSVSGNLTS
ncbi:hypothetical protein BDP27DRAFT_1396891 [Rhodocollybia butyracea]|uniref:Uncharacterized protein n=1 Tax=Rhodocollybia butyracea TaxID=206335 RepID=A0A9P5UGP2_9AGAR|nr:hypothetical protein BDP27DRAFT_1396891 [Rhodocollybia butyracea]